MVKGPHHDRRSNNYNSTYSWGRLSLSELAPLAGGPLKYFTPKLSDLDTIWPVETCGNTLRVISNQKNSLLAGKRWGNEKREIFFSKNELHCIMISFQIQFDWVIFCLLKIFRNQPLIVRQVWGVWLCTYFWSPPPTGELNLGSKQVWNFPLLEWYLGIVHLSRDNEHTTDYDDLLGWLNTHEFFFLFFLHNKQTIIHNSQILHFPINFTFPVYWP